MFNINDFSYKNRNEMVNRIREKRLLEESSSWNIEKFDTAEKIGAELKRLHDEKEKHLEADDMPSMYYENIDRHIEELNTKMGRFDCECEELDESLALGIAAMLAASIPIVASIGINNLFKPGYRKDLIDTNINNIVHQKQNNKKVRYFTGSEILRIIKKYNNEKYSETQDLFKLLYKRTTAKNKLAYTEVKIDYNDETKNAIDKISNNFIKALENKKSIKSLKEDTLLESRLPSDPNVDPQFGVPSQKKYPLFDEKHVRSAIKLFGHVDAEYEQQLARAIMAKMKKYGISYDEVGPDNKLYKWIPESYKNKK